MLPYDVQASAIFFVGSPRPINVGSNLDPFGLGYTGRWLDATGKTIPRNSERTGCDACFPVTTNGVTTFDSVSAWDRKVDFRFAKSVKIQHLTLQGMLDAGHVQRPEPERRHGLYDEHFLAHVFATVDVDELVLSTAPDPVWVPRQLLIRLRACGASARQVRCRDSGLSARRVRCRDCGASPRQVVAYEASGSPRDDWRGRVVW